MKGEWLKVRRGDAPLVVAFPHGGTEIPPEIETRFVSPWLARKDTDWWIASLYGFAASLDATMVATTVSRSVIDVNRDPSGQSLYPGQATTELCPTTTFDGEPLYRDAAPDRDEIERRRQRWFDPYHSALQAEIERLRVRHGAVVLYDAHSIRSRIPRLFEGELPLFNIGTNRGVTCARQLADAVTSACAASGLGHVLNGRFQGGWTTRHYGTPADGVHAIQMELAMRGYMAEPDPPTPGSWPTTMATSPVIAPVLAEILDLTLAFAREHA